MCQLCFNHAELIIEAAECIRESRYPNFQHIIIDDSSAATEVLKLKDYLVGLKDSLIELHYHEKNLGIRTSQNHGVSSVKGRYFIIINVFESNLDN